MKRLRQKAILELVRTGNIASQEDLLEGLQARKIEVSQSTLSRDIQELRLAKAGGMYAVAVVAGESQRVPNDSLRRIIKQIVVGIEAGENTIFIAARSVKDARKLEKRLRDLLQ